MLSYLLNSFTMLVLCVLCLFFCWLLYRTNRTTPGVAAWSLGTGSFAIALIASSTLYYSPYWFGVIFSNHLFWAAMVLQVAALLTFFSRPMYWLPVILGGLCYSVLIIYFTYIEPSIAARIMVFSLNYIVYLGCLAYLFITRTTPTYRSAASLFYVIALTAVGLMLYRLWALFAKSSQQGDQLYDILVQLIHGLPFFISFAMIVVFFLLSNERHYHRVQQLQYEAQQQAAQKKHLLAFLSHEFRTPLNAIVGTSQLLARQLNTPSQKAAVEDIISAGMELSAINQLILRQAEVEHAGEHLLKPSPTELRHWLAELVQQHLDSANEKQLQLILKVAPDVPDWLMVDTTYLRHILANLLSNAIKYSEQGSITLHLCRGDGVANYHFSVTDQGPGICAAEQAQLTEPFRRAWQGIQHTGSGLGLALVQQFLQSLGSTLTIDSSEGQGSTFSFILTLPNSPPHVHPKLAEQPPLHLLIVEDIEMNQVVAKGLVQQLGHTCEVAPSLHVAKQLLRQRYFDGILLDLNLTDGNGIEAFSDLRQNIQPLPPAILVTANVSQQTETQALQAGIVDVLHKPLLAETLTLTLSAHMRPLKCFDAEQFWQIAHVIPAQVRDQKLASLEQEFDLLFNQLLEFQRQDDKQQMEQLLHKIGSKAATLGFTKLAVICEQLSHTANAQQLHPEVLADLMRTSVQALNQQRKEQTYA